MSLKLTLATLSIVVALSLAGMTGTVTNAQDTEQFSKNAMIVQCLDNLNLDKCFDESELKELEKESEAIEKAISELKASHMATYEEFFTEPEFFKWRIPWAKSRYDLPLTPYDPWSSQ